MEKITFFDVEVLNQDPSSICAIGLVEWVDQTVTRTFYSLIKPSSLQGDHARFRVHHIHIRELLDQPDFKTVWEEVADFFEDHIVISHDIVVDMNYLMAALSKSGLAYPSCRLSCTHILTMIFYPSLKGYSLSVIAERFHIDFKAHHALEDARCCSCLLALLLQEQGASSLTELHERYHLAFGTMKPHYYKHMPLYKTIPDQSGSLLNETICLTGTLQHSKRLLEEKLQVKGGHFSRNVSYHTSILVVGKKGFWKNRYGKKNAKVNKAKHLIALGQDIRIIHESLFLKMLK